MGSPAQWAKPTQHDIAPRLTIRGKLGRARAARIRRVRRSAEIRSAADKPGMQKVITLRPEPGAAPDAKTVKRRFMALNNERLGRVRESLSPEQRAFLDVLPLLFHINESKLPGFVSGKTPMGVANFTASKRACDAAAKLARKFSYRRRAMRTYSIQGLYMIGSSGSIGYSDKSDFDIWVCHHPELSAIQVDGLGEKAEKIRAWAESLKLDVKFFILDPTNFKEGETEALSEDHSGSAQRHLLLEEFYRTGLLVAGRYPAWWVVPPDTELGYDAYLRQLVEQGLVQDHEYIDFGEIACIPPGEFVGAALWQLHKAVDSPYKSVLKLLLMEAYAAEYPRTDLLCTRFKRLVYTGESNVDELDPYVLMSKKVEEYLSERGERERLELARKCFYFKVGEKLSDRPPRVPDHRRTMMASLATEWRWSRDQLLLLDSRATWKIQQVLDERKTLVDELTRSYQIVSTFARQHAQSANINSADLNLLGRRLYAAFERKSGKVDIVNPGISTDLTEAHLSFVEVNEHDRSTWLLYRGEHDQSSERKAAPMKRAQTLIELIAWCHFNKMIGHQTLITLQNGHGSVNARELLAVIDTFRRLFPDGYLPKTEMERFKQPARVVSSALYINLGVDPLSSHTRQGVHLTSNRSDALSYGGFWKNLALSFDLFLVTSWNEVLTFHYSGENALLDCFCDYLAWAPLSNGTSPPFLPVYSFSTTRGMAIAHRIEELFRDTTHAFYGSARGRSSRYVLRIEHDYYVLQAENDVPRYERARTEQELIRILGNAQEEFSPIVFDRYAVHDTPLGRLAPHNRPHVVQLFYQVRGAKAEVYVIDERGSVFHQTAEHHSDASLEEQYRRFLESVIRRGNASEHAAATGMDIAPHVEFYLVKGDGSGHTCVERSNQAARPRAQDYFSIQVIGDADQRAFSLYCDGREFSSLEFGDELFSRVARHVLAHRRSSDRYPIYITDVDVGRGLLQAEGAVNLQTVHYLSYKKKIEQKLNAALQAI
jgi:adenylate cyclase class 1